MDVGTSHANPGEALSNIHTSVIALRPCDGLHVSAACNANFHTTGSHYINADTTAFMQFLTADLFKDFP